MKRAEGLEQQPLSDIGRSRSRPCKPQADVDTLHECTGCSKVLPRKQFSKRQLSLLLSQGRGRCHACAAQACAVNVTRQARKRPIDALEASDDDDSEDERYKTDLLRSVDEARRSGGGTSTGATSLPADLSVPIDESNPGHRMLQKLGWMPGSGLGLQGQGGVDPPALVSRQGRCGLGQLPSGGAANEQPTALNRRSGTAVTLARSSSTSGDHMISVAEAPKRGGGWGAATTGV